VGTVIEFPSLELGNPDTRYGANRLSVLRRAGLMIARNTFSTTWITAPLSRNAEDNLLGDDSQARRICYARLVPRPSISSMVMMTMP
jgi:hypothetical protein